LKYAIDLLKYEKHFFMALHSGYSPKRRRSTNIEVQPDDKPTLSKLIEFVKVKHDVPEILNSFKAISENQKFLPARNFSVDGAWLVFKRVYVDESEPEVLFITHGTKTVIDFCDGNNTAKNISQKVQHRLGLDGKEKDIYNILNQLLASDCVEVVTNEGPA
jgi:hypothetical protein